MPDLVTALSQQAQTLQPADRVRLAELLLDSIHQSTDDEVESAWDTEILSRLESIDQGTAELISVDDAFTQVRRSLK